MTEPVIRRTEVFLSALSILATLVLIYVLQPLASPILWSVAISAMFYPMYAKLRRGMNNDSRAALLTVAMMFALVMVPAVILALSLLEELTKLVAGLQTGRIDVFAIIERSMEKAPSWMKSILGRLGLTSVEGIKPALQKLISSNSQWLGGSMLEVGQFVLNAMINIVLILYLSFFLLPDGRSIARRIGRALPLEEQHREILSKQFVTTATATIKGSVAVAAVQGIIGGLTFWMLGFPLPLLWGCTMAALSLVPVFGAALLWLPAALYLLLTGETGKATVLLLIGSLVISSVDNVLRPLIIGKDTGMPDYLVLLATLGGVSMFGFDGLLIGPLVASVFLSVWQTDVSSFPNARSIERPT